MKNKQIVVTCPKCKRLIAYGPAMDQEEAEQTKSKCTMNPFGAPRCHHCKGIEPYSDINLMHEINIVDFDPERDFDHAKL